MNSPSIGIPPRDPLIGLRGPLDIGRPQPKSCPIELSKLSIRDIMKVLIPDQATKAGYDSHKCPIVTSTAWHRGSLTPRKRQKITIAVGHGVFGKPARWNDPLRVWIGDQIVTPGIVSACDRGKSTTSFLFLASDRRYSQMAASESVQSSVEGPEIISRATRLSQLQTGILMYRVVVLGSSAPPLLLRSQGKFLSRSDS